MVDHKFKGDIMAAHLGFIARICLYRLISLLKETPYKMCCYNVLSGKYPLSYNFELSPYMTPNTQLR